MKSDINTGAVKEERRDEGLGMEAGWRPTIGDVCDVCDVHKAACPPSGAQMLDISSYSDATPYSGHNTPGHKKANNYTTQA